MLVEPSVGRCGVVVSSRTHLLSWGIADGTTCVVRDTSGARWSSRDRTFIAVSRLVPGSHAFPGRQDDLLWTIQSSIVDRGSLAGAG